MKTIFTLITLTLLFSNAANAQAIEEVQNPFENNRVNYFKKTIVVFNEYLDTQTGSCNTTNVRFILPIGTKSWNFRADLPLVSKNIDGVNTTGLGDFSFGAANIPYLDEKRGFAVRLRIITDSSNDPLLGSGKWIAVPALMYGQYLGTKKEYLWISTIENFSSFAGSGNRKTIETTVYENLLIHYFGKNWLGADVAFRYNSTAKGFQNNAYLEYGRKMTDTFSAYIHPSIAFGDKKAYNQGLEVGCLLLF